MLNAETYITKEEGIGGDIRTYYEDFYVEEIPLVEPTGEGPNTWIWIEKLGRTTLDVLLDISRDLHISRKRMGFAGMKDKKAITRQWICISNMEPEEIQDLEVYKTKFLKITQSQKKLRMGQLVGNKFKILIRNTDMGIDEAAQRANEILSKLEVTGVPNYYGWQRFGYPRTNTHKIGQALAENNLKKAVDSYIGNPYEGEGEENICARTSYDSGDYEKALEIMPRNMRYEKMMLKIIVKEASKRELDDRSYIKAIHALPKPLQRMFIHAYQSALFNKAVSERIKLGIDKYIPGDIVADNEEHLIHEGTEEEYQNLINEFQAHPTAPLYGTKVPFAEGEVGDLEKQVLVDEGISREDFACPLTPKLGSHGLRRPIRFKVWDIKVTPRDEGLCVQFAIPKGCYATAVLREVMKTEIIN